MKRNTVRLTESQLHKVIKESVKKVLSELDWKTYANASRKWADHLMQHPDDPRRKSSIIGHENSTSTHDIPTDNRLRGFNDAMSKAFNKDYGYNSLDSDEVEQNGLGIRDKEGFYEMPWETDNIGAQGYYDRLSTETGTQRPNKSPYIPHRMRDEFDLPDSKGNMTRKPHRAYDLKGAWDKTRKDMSPTDSKFDDGKFPYMKARNKGNQEIMDYQNGNYEYIKGKGWQLKK